MTRKHFEFIADTISKLNVDRETRAEVGCAFAEALASTNERFNETVFAVACINDNVLDKMKKGKADVTVPLINKKPIKKT